jgi:CheY-like chemotaxis protein
VARLSQIVADQMQRIRVLVVDDERNARTALCELLQDEGYDVDMAADGAEALDKVATFRPQVVLSDVKMPRVDGVALHEALAAGAFAPVVILMSADPQTSLDGFFVQKPIGMTELYRVVAAASERARAA